MTDPIEAQPLIAKPHSVARIWVPMAVFLIVLGSVLFLVENDIIKIAVQIIVGGAE